VEGNNKMNKKHILSTVSLILLTSCGGGGSSGGGNNNPSHAPKNLLPLNVSLNSSSNNQVAGNAISIVDISKLGSHLQYKLTLSNPNSVAVTLTKNGRFALGVDEGWLDHQKSIHGDTYIITKNPNIYNISSHFIKTNNGDDCFNILSINPGSSCSFYVLAGNIGLNFSNQNTFSFPLQYIIYQTDAPANILNVQQCSYTAEINTYNCDNANRTGFTNQFISYKTTPMNGNAPAALFHAFNGFSKDGGHIYMCDQNFNGINCGKYLLNYNNQSNVLTVGAQATAFTLPRQSANRWYAPLVSADGNTAWYVFTNPYQVINSNQPGTVYNIPNIQYSELPGAIMGLDNSFWWNIYNNSANYNSSIYDINSNTFIETNIAYPIAAVATDGVVIGRDDSCWRKTGNNYTSYVPKAIANYIRPQNGSRHITSRNAVYIQMNVPNIVDSNNNTITTNPLTAFYKIHTESGKCEIQLDDYVMTTAATNQWTMGGGQVGKFITSSANVYFGK
jgi:hypothetical protein